MTILGSIRFETKQVIAARKGLITQLRAPAWAYDAERHGRKLTRAGAARAGDLFWLAEPFVIYELRSGGGGMAMAFPADRDDGFAHPPKWMGATLEATGSRGWKSRIRTQRKTPDKLKRHLSKRTLCITATRAERLHLITSADAESCGAELRMIIDRPAYRMRHDHAAHGQTPAEAYLAWWKRAHGKDSYAANPIVAVLEFRLIEDNADEYLARLNADAGAMRAAEEALGAAA